MRLAALHGCLSAYALFVNWLPSGQFSPLVCIDSAVYFILGMCKLGMLVRCSVAFCLSRFKVIFPEHVRWKSRNHCRPVWALPFNAFLARLSHRKPHYPGHSLEPSKLQNHPIPRQSVRRSPETAMVPWEARGKSIENRVEALPAEAISCILPVG